MKKIIECVPNFSEGRDKKKIVLILAEIKKIRGVKILDVDINPDYNRTVLTYVIEPQKAKRAGFLAIAKACELIDMSYHKGEHPRMGACDVFPFVPISGVTMEECVRLAKELGAEVGAKLGIPVYLYGEAAIRSEKRDLSAIRSGEYEGLEEKLKNPFWKSDFGPAVFHRKSGATIIGAREPLIAFNVNLKTSDKKIADRIARTIRESSGGMKAVKAIGVFLKEYGICQVSMNLTNYKMTPLYEVFEIIKRVSPGLAEVSGSEIVGLVPKEAILMAGRFYTPEEKSEEKLIKAAVKNLGLNSLKKFNPKKKVIEYLI